MTTPTSFIMALQYISGILPQIVNDCCLAAKEKNYSESLYDFKDFAQYAKKYNGRTKKYCEINNLELEKAYKKALIALEESFENEINYITYENQMFPIVPQGKTDGPLIFFYRGNLNAILSNKSISIIGSSHPTKAAEYTTKKLTHYLAKLDFNIVGGLEIGCNSIGHSKVLEYRRDYSKGYTTAILPNGIDTKSLYPKENRILAENIVANGGLLLSEFPIHTKCTPHNLVRRDLLQTELSKMVIPIQTTINGRTMHAIKHAKHIGVPIAIPYIKDDYAQKEKYENEENLIGFKNIIENFGGLIINSIQDLSKILFEKGLINHIY